MGPALIALGAVVGLVLATLLILVFRGLLSARQFALFALGAAVGSAAGIVFLDSHHG